MRQQIAVIIEVKYVLEGILLWWENDSQTSWNDNESMVRIDQEDSLGFGTVYDDDHGRVWTVDEDWIFDEGTKTEWLSDKALLGLWKGWSHYSAVGWKKGTFQGIDCCPFHLFYGYATKQRHTWWHMVVVDSK